MPQNLFTFTQNAKFWVTHLLPHLTCMNRKIMPSSRQTQPTTMYAMPRNGFFPPRRDVVDKIILFVPSNLVTI